MQELLKEYARVLLFTCLKIKKDEPLYIMGPIEAIDFIRYVTQEAYEYGLEDIYLDLSDAYIKHQQLQLLDIEQIKKCKIFDRSKLNEYAKKGSAILSLCSVYPDLNNDIDSKKLASVNKITIETCPLYNERRAKNELSWCIAAVATKDWADKLYPNIENNINKLWELILKICSIKNGESNKLIENKIKVTHDRAQKLNDLHIKYFKYTNSLGTNLTLKMPKDYLFHNIEMKLKDNRIVYPNMPSEEVYSSVDKYGTQGIVYSSKPLIHNGKIIDKFWLKFDKGKVVDYDAETGYEELKELINLCPNSDYLGEIAFVDYDSPISNTNMLFYTTLYDENASCHLALGESFADCIVNGLEYTKEQLEQKGFNQCLSHVDFMIGTKDLQIIGIDDNDKEIQIFKDGNFVI